MNRQPARNKIPTWPEPFPEGPLILFDGVCNLCNAMVDLVLRNDPDGRFRFAAMQSPAGRSLLGKLGYAPDQAETMLLVEDDRVFDKSEATLRIARRLRWPWRWLGGLRVLPCGFRDAVYDLVGRNRYRFFGRRASCRAPRPDECDRFLSLD